MFRQEKEPGPERTTLMNARKIILILAVIAVTAGMAAADWNTGEPAKWVQMPDLSMNGIDVNAVYDFEAAGAFPKLLTLADDFPCKETSKITDIHIWGSWKGDILPQVLKPVAPFFFDDPGSVAFRLSIYEDIKAGEGGLSYSRPGDEKWFKDFAPNEFAVRQYATNLEEGWLDPLSGNFVFPGDTEVWQYNFKIDPLEAFEQLGTADAPLVYWLGVHAMPVDDAGGAPLFGWKTSVDVWTDNPVYGPSGLVNFPAVDSWEILDVTDLAFVIAPEPATMTMLVLGALALIRRRRTSG